MATNDSRDLDVSRVAIVRAPWDREGKYAECRAEVALTRDPLFNGAQVRAVRSQFFTNKIIVSSHWLPYQPNADADWESDALIDVFDGKHVYVERVVDLEVVPGTPLWRHADLMKLIPGSTVSESLRNALCVFASRPAIGMEDGGEGWVWESYHNLHVRSSVAHTWLQQNCEPGSFVGVSSCPNREAIWAMLGCLLGGFVFVPLNIHLLPELAKHIVREAHLRVVFAERDQVALYDEVATSISHEMIVFPLLPCEHTGRHSFRDLVFNEVEAVETKIKAMEATLLSSLSSFEGNTQGGNGEKPLCYQLVEFVDPPVVITYTSGSTGLPKGAICLQSTLNQDITSRCGSQSDETSVHASHSPMSVSTFTENVLKTLCHGGRRAFIRDISRIFESLQTIEPSISSFVPQIWAMLYKEYEISINSNVDSIEGLKVQFHSKLGRRVATLNCGGAMPNPHVQAWLRSTYGSFARITENYASTEAGAITTSGDYEGEHKVVDGVEVRLKDWEHYRSSDLPHPRGEICVRTGEMCGGYLNRPDLTQQMFDEDGFFHTGDIGELWDEIDTHGNHVQRLRIVDRKHSFFKLHNGEFVSPELIEAALLQSQVVRQSFVYGDSAHDTVVAVIVPIRDEISKDDVLTSCRDCVASAGLRHFEQPSAVHLTSTVFTSQNGLLTQTNKLCRPRLRSFFKAELKELLDAGGQDQDSRASEASKAEDILKSALARSEPTSAELEEWQALPWSSIWAVQLHGVIKRSFDVDVSLACFAGASERPSLLSIIHAIQGDAPAQLLDDDVDLMVECQLPPELLILRDSNLGTCGPKVGATLLTGVTGFFGAALLRELLRDSEVCPVYCIVRASSPEMALDRVANAMARNGYSQDSGWNLEKIRAIQGDLLAPRLGMNDVDFAEVLLNCRFVVHSAADVNHLAHYRDMAPCNVAATKEIIALCCNPSGPSKQLCFISTLSVVAEDAEQDSRTLASVVSSKGGYIQSKWVAEELVLAACTANIIHGMVVRPGMLGPATDTGAANMNDWIVRYVTGAILLGCYCAQDDSACFSACPVGHAAQATVALLHGNRDNGSILALPERHVHAERFMQLVFSAESLRSRGGGGVSQGVWAELLVSLPETNPIYPLKVRLSRGLGSSARPSAFPDAASAKAVDAANESKCPTYEAADINSFVDWLQMHHELLSDIPLMHRTLTPIASPLRRTVSAPTQFSRPPLPSPLERAKTEVKAGENEELELIEILKMFHKRINAKLRE